MAAGGARRAGAGDSAELVRLAALMYTSMGIDASGHEWQQSALDNVRRRLATGEMAAWVVDGDAPGRLVAAGAVTVAERLPGPGNPSGRVAYIQWICTEPTHRRAGLAHQIMSGLMGWVAEQQVTVAELHATAAGQGLYRSIGFADPPNPQLVFRS
jgi:predicted acetyltransferase